MMMIPNRLTLGYAPSATTEAQADCAKRPVGDGKGCRRLAQGVIIGRNRLDFVSDDNVITPAMLSAIRQQLVDVYVEECEALGIQVSVDDVMTAFRPRLLFLADSARLRRMRRSCGYRGSR
jgi:hypothetical protein